VVAPLPARKPMPEPEWLQFEGEAEWNSELGRFALRPVDDLDITLFFRSADVLIEGSDVSVLKGAAATQILVPQGSPVRQGDSLASHPECGGSTMCLGRIEFCCPTRKALDRCAGSWRCP
jgi:hypothetical protein